MFDLRHAVLAYWSARSVKTDAQLKAISRKRLDRWLDQAVPRVPFYQNKTYKVLTDLPIVEKADLMADFAAFNTQGITADMGWNAFDGDKHVENYIVGASTGTSGNRGLFVISQAERYKWLGTILAKALPGFWRTRHRIAVLLPMNTPLYDSANQMGRLRLQFFDLASDWADALCAFRPTVIIAPPKVLRLMAEQKLTLNPSHIFAGAETLDALDRNVIRAYFNQTVGQIYMATEGLMAVSCPRGTLHLCEDTMHFELPEIAQSPGLHEVIVSDFSRDVQIMARYRMNDLIRLGPPCECGLPHRTVAEVVGRKDDCFILSGITITPDILRNAVVDADRRINDFRVVQTGPKTIEAMIPIGCDRDAVKCALDSVLNARHTRADVVVTFQQITADMTRKLRRVENRYCPQA